jgi:hypothetical protein
MLDGAPRLGRDRDPLAALSSPAEPGKERQEDIRATAAVPGAIEARWSTRGAADRIVPRAGPHVVGVAATTGRQRLHDDASIRLEAEDDFPLEPL